MGNQLIGALCLRYLVEAGDDVGAVFTLPDEYWRKLGGKKGEDDWYPRVQEVARTYGLPNYAPIDINEQRYVDIIRRLEPDVIFSISWDQMLGEEILSIPKMGCINWHGSLLPRHRGHAPMNWAIIHGDAETGVTMHYMVKKADRGDILGQVRVSIGKDDDAGDVHRELTRVGSLLFRELLPKIRSGTAPRDPQDQKAGNYNKRRRPEDGAINWNWTTLRVYDWVRALTHPYPGAFTDLPDGRRLYIWRASLPKGPVGMLMPGKWVVGMGGVWVGTWGGAVSVERYQFGDGEDVSGTDTWERELGSRGRFE